MTSELKKKALTSLKGKWGFAVGSTFLYILASAFGSYVISGIIAILSNWFQDTFLQVVLSLISVLATFFLTGILVLGIFKIYLGLAQGKNVQVGDLFSYFAGWAKIWKAFLTVFFLTLYTFLWSVLLIVPGIIKSFSYSLTYFVLLDHPEFTVNRALGESKRLMQGQKWKLFVVLLSFIGWYLLSIITLGLANLWVTPYVSVSFAHFYENLKKSDVA
ncbi:DUF975 family protein [Ectobacillus sp. sgz5001026]|uniref:DUF975 family protein n=1 Tax=Ectobacillus sp. sgz5001026 TaxID=3242473 RepID=UPI0036D2C11E